jgi:ankyrin repeat protein
LTNEEKVLQLVLASRSGDIKQTERLLWAGADVNGSVFVNADSDSGTFMVCPTIAAAWNGNINVLKALISRGADVNVQCHDTLDFHRTPLFAAATQGNVEAVQLLLASGARIDLHDGLYYDNALCCAARAGKLETVRVLIQHGADVNSSGDKGVSALGSAIHCGYTDVAEYLLLRGACVELEICRHGRPLDCASSNGNLILARALLQYGARDSERQAIEVAASKGHVEVFELLANHHWEITLAESRHGSLLGEVCFWGRETAAEWLLQKAIDVNAHNDKHLSLLALAIKGGSPRVIRCLLERRAHLKSEEELEQMLFRSDEAQPTQLGTQDESLSATTNACRNAAAICRTLCCVIEDVGSPITLATKRKCRLTLNAIRGLAVCLRTALVKMNRDFDLPDLFQPLSDGSPYVPSMSMEGHEKFAECFATLAYLEDTAQKHLVAMLGNRAPWSLKTNTIFELEPSMARPKFALR